MSTKNSINDKPNELKNAKVIEKLQRIKKLKAVKKIIEQKNVFLQTVKNNKYKLFVGLSITAALSLTFKSDESMVFDTSKINVPVTKNTVIFGKETKDVNDFYRKTTYEHGSWFYKEKGKFDYAQNIDKKINHNLINKTRLSYNRNRELNLIYEDSYLSYKIDTLRRDTTNIVCHIEEKLGGHSSGKPLGFFTGGGRKIVIYNFLPDTTLNNDTQQRLALEIKKRFDYKKNAVEPHERGHDENDQKGINSRVGLGMERTFKLYKHDEVSANIHQFLAQRKNYLENGKDESKITGVFKFYLNKIKEQNIIPSIDFIAEDEVKIIGEGIREMWEKSFTNSYKQRHKDNMERRILAENITYDAIDAEDKYQEILADVYKISAPNGQYLNFGPYIKDFELRDYEKEDLAKLREKKPLNEIDKLGMILDKYGEKAYHCYIKEQKERVEREDRAREEAKKEQERRASIAFSQGNEQRPTQQNREAVINGERRIAQNRRQRRNSR